MRNYISADIRIEPWNEDASDLMAALLADEGYESFETSGDTLSAYILADNFDRKRLDNAVASFPMSEKLICTVREIEGEDWNSEWERNYFKPIVIDGRCVIHSSFHQDIPEAEYDIVIDPKMAFGTGHHATTSMMVGYLLDLDLNCKQVIDMGTGTGILSILAAMRGASSVTGIEIDPDAAENARENVAVNLKCDCGDCDCGGNTEKCGCDDCKCGTVEILTGDSSLLADIEPADIFVANINRNVILADMERYAAALNPGGTMLLSGFYEADIPMVENMAKTFGITLLQTRREEGDWVALRLHKA